MKITCRLLLALLLVAGAGAVHAADNCELTIDSNDQMRFDKDTMTVDASCESVTVTLTHSGTMAANIMGHNWVLTTEADMQGAVQSGMSAGLENDYVDGEDESVIAYTEIIGGGEETSVTFDLADLDPDGSYVYFCSFPGHSALMKGSFIIE